ncbi:hypothetical protein AB0P19_14190 [Microbacterium oleivorans]|uniref:hypothetical protein n=1 Tax=Microbacterium TaxID=33882 RepID=UPI003400DA87
MRRIALPVLGLSTLLLVPGCATSATPDVASDAIQEPAAAPVEEAPVAATPVNVTGTMSIPDRVGDFVLVTTAMADELETAGLDCLSLGGPWWKEGDYAYNPPRRAFLESSYVADWDSTLSSSSCTDAEKTTISVYVTDYQTDAEAAADLSRAQTNYTDGAVQCTTGGVNPLCAIQNGKWVVSAVAPKSADLFGDPSAAAARTAQLLKELNASITF